MKVWQLLLENAAKLALRLSIRQDRMMLVAGKKGSKE